MKEQIENTLLRVRKILRRKKNLYNLIFIILCLITITFLLFHASKKASKQKNIPEKNQKIKIEVAADSIDIDKMWRNHLEEQIETNSMQTQNQINEIKSLVKKENESTKNENKNSIDFIKNDLEYSQKRFDQLFREIRELQKINDGKSQIDLNPSKFSVMNLEIDDSEYSMPEDSRYYIPETSYLTGYLMGGIAVSTSIGSASEPVPVAIRVIDRGNFPENFSTNLKDCRILGSAYGDLSSERAIIRAESMICRNSSKNEITTTKMTGIIYGDDGMNGIRGRVIDMSSKHIKNAAIGGVLSGFSSTLKSESMGSMNPLSAISNNDMKLEQKLRNNSLSGMSNAAEKIAEYYIKKAENMSPILMIPGGTKVDVVFTKGVSFRSQNIQNKIINERR